MNGRCDVGHDSIRYSLECIFHSTTEREGMVKGQKKKKTEVHNA